MGAASFLFEGEPPPSTTTYGSTVSDVPVWFNDYQQALVGRANAIASEPYQAYTGPRIAGFTDAQRQAFDMTPTAAASYKPALQDAQYFTNVGGTGSALDATQSYFNRASKTVPQNIQSYMNPYTTNVVDRIGDLATRQLEENIIPKVQSQFIAGGTFGGSRSGEALGKAVRDLGESTTAAQSQALERGYTQSAQQVQNDLNRFAQMGQVAGTLSSQDLTRALTAGEQSGRLGALSQALGLTEAGALETVGRTQQAQQQQNLDLAYQDFANQRDFDRNNIAFMNAAIRGMQIPTSTYTESYGPANTYQPSPLAQIGQTAATYYGMSNLGKR
jgi:hypothetical protein